MDFLSAYKAVTTALGAITDAASAKVLREHVSFLRDQIEVLRKSHEDTEKELSETKAKCNQLHNEIASYRETEEFVQHEGALFKKDAAGSYITSVYCPSCRKIASAGFDVFPFSCKACGWDSIFTQRDLRKVMNTLP